MPVQSLREALALVRTQPALWVLGIVSGAIGAATIFVQLFLQDSIAERINILQLIVLPFFIGGAMEAIRRSGTRLSDLLDGGKQHYFRILLATMVIVFAALFTIIAAIAGLSLLGAGVDEPVLPLIIPGILLPFLYFTYFYDAAIVFEGRRSLDAIRRSVEFVLLNSLRAFVFLVLNIFIIAVIGFFSLFLWAVLVAEKLEPLIEIDQTVLQQFTMQELLQSLGTGGMLVTVIVSFAGLTAGVVFLYAYKIAFFRRYAGTAPEPAGEYDEKGRWYRY